jgi:hypothetical protein
VLGTLCIFVVVVLSAIGIELRTSVSRHVLLLLK